jgi:hypothetical protein
MTTHAMTAAPLVTRILHLPITTDVEAFVTVARATERVVVQLGNPGFENRDRLGRFVVRGIETELGRLGAAPPGWRYDDGIEAILSDQIYRARLLGCAGLALSFPSLRDLADASGQLGAEDSNTLRQLVELAEREPLQLYIPRPCTELRVVGTTELLSAWLPASAEPGRIASIEYDHLAALPAVDELASLEAPDMPSLAAPPLEAFIDGQDLPPSPTPPPVCVFGDSTPRPPHTVELMLPDALGLDTPAPSGTVDAADTRGGSVLVEDSPAPPSVRAGARHGDSSPADAPGEIAPADQDQRGTGVDRGTSAPLPTSPTPPAAAAPNVDPQRIQRCLAWANQLRSMNGPKVHGSIEKAFVTAYLPLCREIAAGIAPPEAVAVADRWAEGFAQSYAAAFRQLASRTSRRPRMVKDVVDISVRWLGQHHARQCQLLLVSAMRFDLGQRLNEALEHRLATRAVCVDQCVLWTALPSNADTQQLAAGDAPATRRALGEPPSRAAAPGIVPFNVGNRGLFRLDPVPAELNEAGELESERLERLATTLADRVEPWILEQPPETLIVIFGDHGFHWRASPRGTTAPNRCSYQPAPGCCARRGTRSAPRPGSIDAVREPAKPYREPGRSLGHCRRREDLRAPEQYAVMG